MAAATAPVLLELVRWQQSVAAGSVVDSITLECEQIQVLPI